MGNFIYVLIPKSKEVLNDLPVWREQDVTMDRGKEYATLLLGSGAGASRNHWRSSDVRSFVVDALMLIGLLPCLSRAATRPPEGFDSLLLTLTPISCGCGPTLQLTATGTFWQCKEPNDAGPLRPR